MATGAAFFYISMAAAAAGTVVSTIDAINASKARERILEQELRTNELNALDQENERLIGLREANDEILANSGGVGAYASPSLIAGRAFNFKVGMDDITNIRFNQLNSDAAISARISILKSNQHATLAAGIFQLTAQTFGALDKHSQLSKVTTTTPATTGSKAGVVSPSIFIKKPGS